MYVNVGGLDGEAIRVVSRPDLGDGAFVLIDLGPFSVLIRRAQAVELRDRLAAALAADELTVEQLVV